MGTAFYQQRLRDLCSTQETFERAKSILSLVSLRTGRGTGFSGNTAILPAVAAYLASEELGANEVDLKTAAHAACVQPRAFEDFLKKVRKAIQLDDNQNQQGVMGGVTYRSLVASYVSKDAQGAVEWMEEAEEALPGATLIEYYSTTAVACGVFSWVCDLMEHSIATKVICADYNIPLRTLKAIKNALDQHCGNIADRIRSALPHQSTVSSTTPSKPRPNTRLQLSLTRTPTKSAMKGKTRGEELTPSQTPSQKRTVVFSQSVRDPDDIDDNVSFPATPTRKKRRTDASVNVTGQAGVDLFPTKRTTRATSRDNEDACVAAFHAAITGQTSQVSSQAKTPRPVPPLPHVLNTRATLGDAGPSTPRRPRTIRPSSSTVNIDSPTKSSVAVTPTHSVRTSAPARLRRRYYPVFLDQQQWLARDQKVERIWADAAVHRSEMVNLYGHPLERYRSVLA